MKTTVLARFDTVSSSNNAADIADTGIAPTIDAESAVLLTLGPGKYTSIVRGANNTTGVGLAEAYKLNN